MSTPPPNNAPTVTPTITDYAYAAGIIDGEGTVSIRKKALRAGRRVRDIHTEVIVTITDRPVLEWLQVRWGGGIFFNNRSRPEKQSHWQDIYRWTLYSARARTFLEGIQPYVIVKRAQVELGIEFQGLMDEGWGGNRVHLGSKGFRFLPDEVLEIREQYFRRMQVLNLMGHGYEEREAMKRIWEREAKRLASGLSTASG